MKASVGSVAIGALTGLVCMCWTIPKQKRERERRPSSNALVTSSPQTVSSIDTTRTSVLEREKRCNSTLWVGSFASLRENQYWPTQYWKNTMMILTQWRLNAIFCSAQCDETTLWPSRTGDVKRVFDGQIKAPRTYPLLGLFIPLVMSVCFKPFLAATSSHGWVVFLGNGCIM